MAQREEEYVTAKRAREMLGVGVNRMARLLDDNLPEGDRLLEWKYSALDGRVKLVKMSSLRELARREGRTLVDDQKELKAAA